MKLLEEKILNEGKVYDGDVLKVDGFLNHRVDVEFLNLCGKEFYGIFAGDGVNKVLTVEASGIGIACLTAQYFHCPVVFAKKSKSANQSADVWQSCAHSYTHGTDNTITVAKEYLGKEDKVLMIDDFLASGNAFNALADICRQAGATILGAGAVIEKTYQGGYEALTKQGIRVESLARIASMSKEDGIKFC